LHADFLCFSEPAMARRFLLALIRKLMGVGSERQHETTAGFEHAGYFAEALVRKSFQK
jgi:hypothetical protein